MPLWLFRFPMTSFLVRRDYSLFSIVRVCFVYRQHYLIRKVYHQISLTSILLKVFRRCLKLFLLLIFFIAGSSSSNVNCASLMSSCLIILFVVDLSETFLEFPSRFLECCFLYSWLAAIRIALQVFFLSLSSFFVFRDCLSSSEFPILLIWPWMYSSCSF